MSMVIPSLDDVIRGQPNFTEFDELFAEKNFVAQYFAWRTKPKR